MSNEERERDTKKKQLEEHVATKIGNRTVTQPGIKKSTLERQSPSEVKMDRGLEVCERIVEQFKNNVFLH